MSNTIDRKIHDDVIQLVEEMGFDIKSASFDGKSRDLAARGHSLQPLSVFELQKEIWGELLKVTKKDVLREKIACFIDVHNLESGVPSLSHLCYRALIGYPKIQTSTSPERPIAIPKNKGRKKAAVATKFCLPLSKIPIKRLRVCKSVSLDTKSNHSRVLILFPHFDLDLFLLHANFTSQITYHL